MLNKEELSNQLEEAIASILNDYELNENSKAIIDGTITSTLLTLIEEYPSDIAALFLSRIKNCESEEVFAEFLDKLEPLEREDIRASLYKIFLFYKKKDENITAKIIEINSDTSAEEIAALKETIHTCATAILDLAISKFPEVTEIDLTEDELDHPIDNDWRNVLTEDIAVQMRSDAHLARELLTRQLFENLDSASRVLRNNNLESYNSYLDAAEDILNNGDNHLNILLNYEGHHNLTLNDVIRGRLRPQEALFFIRKITEIELLQTNTLIQNHQSADHQYLKDSVTHNYGGYFTTWAISTGRLPILARLNAVGLGVNEPIDLDIVNRLLHMYIKQPITTRFRELVQFLKSRNLKDDFTIPENGEPLLRSLFKNIAEHREKILLLLDITADLEQKNPLNDTTLAMIAADNCEEEILAKLLKLGANVNAVGINGKTIAHIIVGKNHISHTPINSDGIINLLRIIEPYNPNINTLEHNRTPLGFIAGMGDRVRVAMKLIDMGANIDAPYSQNLSIFQYLFSSKFYNRKLMLKALNVTTSLNSSVNIIEQHGNIISTVDIAILSIKSCFKADEKLVLLWDSVVVPNINKIFGQNCNRYLHYTILYNRMDTNPNTINIINNLCKSGANVNAKNAREETALYLAFSKNVYISVIFALLNNGARVNSKCRSNASIANIKTNYPTLIVDLNQLASTLNEAEKHAELGSSINILSRALNLESSSSSSTRGVKRENGQRDLDQSKRRDLGAEK